MKFTNATLKDANSIARLHAESWKQHYRGICPDNYLDNEVDDDRQAVWSQRLSNHNDKQIVLLASGASDSLCGFACVYLAHHKEWGAYLDNLHVSTMHHRKGIGQALMREAAKRVYNYDAQSKLYLHVLKENKSAIKFYQKIGGRHIATYEEVLPWGSRGEVWDFMWTLDQLY